MSSKFGEPPFDVVTFRTLTGAMRAEKLFLREGLPLKLIPVPRQISSDCGICLRFPRARREEVDSLLREWGEKLGVQKVVEI